MAISSCKEREREQKARKPQQAKQTSNATRPLFRRRREKGSRLGRLSLSWSAVSAAEKWMLCTEHHSSCSCATTCARSNPGPDEKEQRCRRRPILRLLRRPTLIDLFISTVVSCVASNRTLLYCVVLHFIVFYFILSYLAIYIASLSEQTTL